MLEQQIAQPTELITEAQARITEPTVREPDFLAREELKNNHEKNMAGIQGGKIGSLVGTGSEKAGNVATLTIFAFFLLIVGSFLKFDFSTQFEAFYKIITTLLGPIGLALGYLFGSHNSK